MIASLSRNYQRVFHPAQEREPLYVYLVIAGIFFTMFSGQWALLGIPVPVDRVLLITGIALALIDPRTETLRRLQWRAIHTAMAVLTTWTFLSGYFHHTLDEQGIYALLDRIIMPFVLFCISPLLFATEKRRRWLLLMMVFMGIYLGFTAICEVLGPQALVFPKYIMNSNLGLHVGRARGPFLTAEGDGMMMGYALASAFMLWNERKMVLYFAVRSVVPLCIFGMALSSTRSVWLGGILMAAVAFVRIPRTRKPLLVGAAGVTVAFVVMLTLLPSVRSELSTRLNDQRSIDDRSNTNAAAIRIVKEEPLTGIGWTNFLRIGTNYIRLADDYPITNVLIEIHDVPLSRACELGIPAALLWVGIVVAGPARAFYRRGKTDEQLHSFDHAYDPVATDEWRTYCMAIFAVWLAPTLFSPNPYPLPNYFLWLVTGMFASSSLLKSEAELIAMSFKKR